MTQSKVQPIHEEVEKDPEGAADLEKPPSENADTKVPQPLSSISDLKRESTTSE